MTVYKDIFTHHKIFTDAHHFTEVDGLYYLVEGTFIEEQNAIDDDAIGSAGGAGSSEEEPPLVTTRLADDLTGSVGIASQTDFKRAIQSYLKKLLAHIKDNNPSESEAFKASSQKLIANIIENYDSYSFLSTNDDCYDMDGMIIPFQQDAPWGEEKAGDTCKIIVFKAGVYQESA